MRKHTYTQSAEMTTCVKALIKEIQADPSRQRYLEYALGVSHLVKDSTQSGEFSMRPGVRADLYF